MRCVYIAGDAINGHIVWNMLEAEGVIAVVRDNRIAGTPVPLDASFRPSVWVPVEQAAHAIALLKRRQETEGDDWVCSGCGESIEGAFTQCWQYEAVRSSDG